jgi:hypothetical protein
VALLAEITKKTWMCPKQEVLIEYPVCKFMYLSVSAAMQHQDQIKRHALLFELLRQQNMCDVALARRKMGLDATTQPVDMPTEAEHQDPNALLSIASQSWRK